MVIRKCKESDFSLVDKFYQEVVDYLVETINYPRWTPNVYPCARSVKHAILKGEQYGAFINGKVVGAFIFNSDPAGDYDAGEWQKNLYLGEYAVIHTLATHHKEYGNGIAKQMVLYCLNLAKELGFKGVRLDVVPDNFPAIRLYKNLGFNFAGEKDLKRGIEEIPTFYLFEYNF